MASWSDYKFLRHSEYKYVKIYENIKTKELQFRMAVTYIRDKNFKTGCSRTCLSERDAAKAVDLKLISMGKEPVNILKRVAI